VITRDLDVALADAIRAARTAGEVPAPPAPGTPGTWRPAPPGAGPGTYASTIAFRLAQRADPRDVAARLATRLRARQEISEVTVTGGGYLTITVTPDTLAALAVRITEAGPPCARSDTLGGATLTAPGRADLATARTWDEAYQWLISEVTGRLAAAAGAQVLWTDPAARPLPAHSPPRTSSPVADSINFAGVDAVRYALCRIRPPAPGSGRMPAHAVTGVRATAEQHLGNPAYAVRYAHAHAASALRQAADLGLDKGAAAYAQSRLLVHPRELALLDAMSWLPEQVGGAARRGRPHVLAVYLENLAAAYFDCQEGCPAVPPGLPDEPPGHPVTRARLWLVAAARTTLGTGLGLLGVAAPDRL
jgi:arginyl-tRNA synthetase